MAADICVLTLTCRLTRDPELRSTAGGTDVATLRVAYSTRRRDSDGNWGDKSNYLDVKVFGRQAETAMQYLGKGRQIGVTGRLEWREWQGEDGVKRQSYELVADTIKFLDSRQDDGDGDRSDFRPPADQADDFAPAGDFAPAHHPDQDIPFNRTIYDNEF